MKSQIAAYCDRSILRTIDELHRLISASLTEARDMTAAGQYPQATGMLQGTLIGARITLESAARNFCWHDDEGDGYTFTSIAIPGLDDLEDAA